MSLKLAPGSVGPVLCAFVLAGCSGASSGSIPPETPVNRAPTAVDDQVSVKSAADASAIEVLANDSDPDGDALTVSVTSVSGGSATVNPDNTIAVVPDGDAFIGTVVLGYSISDGRLTDTAQLTLSIVGFEARLSWLPPLTRQDGTFISNGDISGYEISFRRQGTSAFEYVSVESATADTHTLTGLPGATYEFRMATLDQTGISGRVSDVVVATIGY